MEPSVEKLTECMAKCREAGLKVTPQRTEIMRELGGRKDHPDAETIFRDVRKRIPAISLDTVYRTLRLFEEKGLVARVGPMGDRARFDADTDRHLHFVCSECGLVRDVHSDALDNFRVPGDVPGAWEVDSVYIELRGRCRSCRKRAREKGK